MTDLQTHAAEIAEQFSDHLHVTDDEVEERLQRYGSVYGSLQDGGTNGTSQNPTPAPETNSSPSSKASSSG